MRADRGELHELVDELPDEQVADVLADVRSRLRRPRNANAKPFAWGAVGPAKRPHPDDAERVDDLLTDAVDDGAIERWLRDEVAGVYDATVADPSRSVSMESVRARLAAERSSDR
jgi:hypothetical protein